MEEQKVTVTGKIDPAVIVKKLKKKTGKRAEVIGLVDSNGADEKEGSEEYSVADESSMHDQGSVMHDVVRDEITTSYSLNHQSPAVRSSYWPSESSRICDSVSNENPCACLIM